MHFSESCLSIHHKLPYKQHSLQPRSEGEYLPPLYAHGMLICAKDSSHPEESTMVSKRKHTKEHEQQTNARQYPFIALLSNIQENANTTFNASEYNTSISFAPRNMLFLLAQPIDAQMSRKIPIAWHV